MKHLYTVIIFLFLGIINVAAQDDLLNMLAQSQTPKATPIYATFKSTRVVTGQSNELVAPKHLNFVILHRFGELNDGLYGLYGLDNANIRLAFDYGLNKNIQIGLARSSFLKTYDANIKIKLLQQKNMGKLNKVGLTYFGNVAVNSLKWDVVSRKNYFTSRLSFVNQLVVSKKINNNVSVLVAPTVVHYNLVAKKTDLNTTFALGLAGSLKITKSTRFNIEYYPQIIGSENTPKTGNNSYNYLGAGFDIETGGHVFQLMFTNGVGMLEQHFINQTSSSWTNAGIRLGFNISRTFSFDDKATEKMW
jgi:hypothetical protein